MTKIRSATKETPVRIKLMENKVMRIGWKTTSPLASSPAVVTERMKETMHRRRKPKKKQRVNRFALFAMKRLILT